MISALLLMSILVLALNQVYALGLELWQEGLERNTARNRLNQSVELISRLLRQAKSIDAIDQGSVTFTADLGGGDTSYRFYLYNPSDAEPNPPYTQDTYELKFAQADIGYGEGSVLASDIEVPETAVFTQLSDLIVVDLTGKYSDQQLTIRTNIGLRNL